MSVTTVKLANRRHYARTENLRTLCGRTGRVTHVEGAADCRRCIQIIEHVDTSLGRQTSVAS